MLHYCCETESDNLRPHLRIQEEASVQKRIFDDHKNQGSEMCIEEDNKKEEKAGLSGKKPDSESKFLQLGIQEAPPSPPSQQEHRQFFGMVQKKEKTIESAKTEGIVSLLIAACKVGDIEKVKGVVLRGGDLRICDPKGNTPFSSALYSCYVPLVDYIVTELQNLDPSYQVDYKSAAAVNVKNYGSVLWPYPRSNIENTTWGDLYVWFSKVNSMNFVVGTGVYKSTWLGSWRSDMSKTAERVKLGVKAGKPSAKAVKGGVKNLEKIFEEYTTELEGRVDSYDQTVRSGSKCKN